MIWTDGACSGNPGPGGWAAIVIPHEGAEPVELSGGEKHTTNNRMELSAALEGLRSLPDGSKVVVVTDSQLMLNSMTKWLPGLEAQGLEDRRGPAGQEPGPADRARRRDQPPRRVRWHWVRGHQTGASFAQAAQRPRGPARGRRRASGALEPFHLTARTHAELVEHRGDVVIDGPHGEVQPRGDLGVGEPVGDELEHVELG